MPVSRATTEAPPAARAARPSWQREPVFRFFASVRLAIVLLAVLIVASIAGTLYETTFDAKVARAYIYNAWWFNGWLTLICINLACAAFSRWPWKRHHTGFLITHLGIITLLIGAMIGRRWGIEGTMTLFKGQPPNNQLMVDQRVLRLQEGEGEIRQYPVEIIGRRPTPARPWALGQTAGGWDIRLVDYAPALDAIFEPRAAPPGVGGAPAVHVRLVSKRLGQAMEQWLLAGDNDHGALDLGLASVQARAGIAPEAVSPAPASATAAAPAVSADTTDERIVAFANQPDTPIVASSAASAAPTGAKVRLTLDPATGKRQVFVDWRGATWAFDAEADRGQDQDLSGSGLRAVVENYWPDFVMRDGKPASASDQPKNPAVLVRLHGSLPAATDAGNGDAAAFGGPVPQGPAPTVGKPANGAPGIGTAADNQALVFCDDRGGLTYTLKSSALPAPLRGTLTPGQSVNTGWADWQLTVDRTIPAAFGQTRFQASKNAVPTRDDRSATSGDPGVVGGGGSGSQPGPQGNAVEGLRVRLSKGGVDREEWVPTGWAITLPTAPQPTRLAYDFQIEPLPIGLQLENFKVTFNEGTDSPASFQSNLKVTDTEGDTGTGSCSMNNPFNFPGRWWNTFSGLTFKMSQASWNPENLDQSVVQILRDPGWLLKWIGSLLVCAGIFTMFYLRPPRMPVPKPDRPV